MQKVRFQGKGSRSFAEQETAIVEEFVRKEHFDEYALRMDERFLSVEKRMEQGFSRAEKAREQNLLHINQRFDDLKQSVNQRLDDMNRRFDDLRGEIRSLRTLVLGLHTPVVLAIVGAAVKYLFFQ